MITSKIKLLNGIYLNHTLSHFLAVVMYLTQFLKAIIAIQFLVFTTVLGAKLTKEKLIE